MKQKKMYIVKREVLASCIEDAATNRGHVYSIELADEKYQPLTTKRYGLQKKSAKSS